MKEGFSAVKHYITSIAGPHQEKLPELLVPASPPLALSVQFQY